MYLLQADLLGLVSKLGAIALSIAGAVLVFRQLFDYLKERDQKALDARVQIEHNKNMSIEKIRQFELQDKAFTEAIALVREDIKRLEEVINDKGRGDEELKKKVEELKEDYKTLIKMALENYMQR